MTLQLQDDETATIEEILAFVDSFEWGNDFFDKSDVLSVDVAFQSEEDSKATSTATGSATAPPKRKRIRTGWSSSTGLQRRKRAELEFLRAHVQELEAYVEQLKRQEPRPQLAAMSKHRTHLDWREVALEEFIERKKSEEANRVLKTIVGNQVLVGQTLTNVLQRTPV
ncbi:hypothetical protein PRNP1_012853 [Phytophthora ramorum]